ncbi:PolC-type DNA polymerase III [Pseudothermotoga thermarum]|uniref:DNA polymerase III PolC-type n=1 Tax=Pseudothermotoga thermarum DSM 5069 TaxID=688269 RepID=F7YV22_9THEM|nr:PolC-type DNA polymerase III [Pseudothermotoga thermarum]AEH50306.1 DNA polymerase III catalytic subunit, PolC type [Pseudothermotoga thermarum DSM 5069]
MKTTLIENLNLNVREFAKNVGIEIESDGTIESAYFDWTTNTLVLKANGLGAEVDLLQSWLRQFLETDVKLIRTDALISLDDIAKELNGTFPYIQSVLLHGDKVVMKVTSEFGKERVESKKPLIRSYIRQKLSIEDIEIVVEEPKIETKIETVKPNLQIVGSSTRVEKEKVEIKESDFLTPSTITTQQGTVKVKGQIFKMEIRGGKKKVLAVCITDKKDSLLCLAFNSVAEKMQAELSEKDCVILEGDLKFEEDEPILYVKEYKKAEPWIRMDESEVKRVELHAHSKFSDLDSVLDISSYVERAKLWGWKAIAITDHGVVQAIPQFYEACKNAGIKPIFGVEAYVVNDSEPIMYNPRDFDISKATYVVVDLETTGLHPMFSEIIEIGAVKIEEGQITDEFHTLVKPKEKLSDFTSYLTGIKQEDLENMPTIEEVLPKFLDFCKDSILVAHNASFDYRFLRYWIRKLTGQDWNVTFVDTLALSKRLVKLSGYNLEKLAAHFKMGSFSHHRALEDAKVTAKIFLELLKLVEKKSFKTFSEIEISQKEIVVRQSKPFHATILVQNKEGLKNLYKLISDAHIKYFHSVPRIPKSDLQALRAGLLIGSACVSGEVIQELLSGADMSEIEQTISFYDFIEIMPLDLLPEDNDLGLTRERLKEVYLKLFEIAEKMNIPIVMTGDVHFLDPEDSKVRDALEAPQKDKLTQQPAAYLRTTNEMMQAAMEIFQDESKARKVVIDYPNQIADSIEMVVPLEKKLHPPKIEEADEQIKTLAIQRAKELYGEPLPELIQKRLEKELNAIINHGYAVLYLIAKKMVDKSLSDGYVVGSRGSVGSSLVAYLLGITEVNPLPPHYFCNQCKYVEFVENSSYGSGYDLPRKKCPKCGNELSRNGQDIPFETFMGFEGDKVPDIDLNFSGEYQDEAHRFIETLFGKSHVYRAGTINTIASKTAYGFVKNYEEKINQKLRKAEVERLVNELMGVKRTTGQHPGGLIIVPKEYEVYDFTPIQYPANVKTAETFTTHFDYEAIHEDLVKIDALGHDDPTFIRLLKEFTGIDPMTIPMDDPDTLKIFSSLEPLKIDPKELGMDVGTLGIPEFGTQFVRGMLSETRPKTFAELVRISGLSHGTDVWLNNAKDWIEQGKATLSEVISCRDDIMNYLIKKGMEASKAFKIMENVRKGKGLSEEEEKNLRELKVPEWFIESCKRIKYLFPKAHAAAYVSMAFRIAYFKVHYPLAFYAAYFTLKGDEFDIDAALGGIKVVRERLQEKAKSTKKDVREKSEETNLEVMLEMFLRGISFLPVNIKKSHSKLFLIEDGKLRIPFNKLPGLGNNVAESIVKAREEKPFTSIEDLIARTKVNKAHLEVIRKYVELENLPEKEQMGLF